MEDVIELENKFYILASSSLARDRTFVLKEGETFAVFDPHGDIRPYRGGGEQGLYHEGTRYVSKLELTLNGSRPLLLNSAIANDNKLFAIDMTNSDFYVGDHIVPRGTVHLFRSIFLWNGGCYQRVRIWNYGRQQIDLSLALSVGSDFKDLFEVRGIKRERRGDYLPEEVREQALFLAYRGLDGVTRTMTADFLTRPDQIRNGEASYRIPVGPAEQQSVLVRLQCGSGENPAAPSVVFEDALREIGVHHRSLREHECGIETSNESFNEWLIRSGSDLHMMMTKTSEGFYPYAGVPWYSTVFGRDGLITGFQTLLVNPALAKGILAYLARHQAQSLSAEQDAEPGKILHEMRKGEMAHLKEIPFGLYYGSVDSTPLFIFLAAAYFERTADLGFIERIWPNILAAMRWIDEYSDLDGDGFVEYKNRSPLGLTNQGWKDSHDSVFHEDGSMAVGPIALCEVQAYVFAAKKRAANLAKSLGYLDKAERWRKEAERLRQAFEKLFWCPELNTYALALDGEKRPCRVRTSNAGHCLFAGIASPGHAAKVADTLFSDASFSGWGIRTVAATEALYNPMSYHNGSVWPHDNALIASGLARYGFKEQALKILSAFFDASQFVGLRRLPELFCGFHRRAEDGPTMYPVACSPQAWASAAVFQLLQSCLGLRARATEKTIHFDQPALPGFLKWVKITNLKVGEDEVDLYIERHTYDVGINVLRRKGQIKVVAVK